MAASFKTVHAGSAFIATIIGGSNTYCVVSRVVVTWSDTQLEVAE